MQAVFEAAKVADATTTPLVLQSPGAVKSLTSDTANMHVGAVLQQLYRGV